MSTIQCNNPFNWNNYLDVEECISTKTIKDVDQIFILLILLRKLPTLLVEMHET